MEGKRQHGWWKGRMNVKGREGAADINVLAIRGAPDKEDTTNPVHTSIHPHTSKQFHSTWLYTPNQYSSFPLRVNPTSVHSLGERETVLCTEVPYGRPLRWPCKVLSSTNATFSFPQKASCIPLTWRFGCLSCFVWCQKVIVTFIQAMHPFWIFEGT